MSAVQIGPYTLANQLILAPMAGVTDQPFRQLCTRLGAGMVSETLTVEGNNRYKRPMWAGNVVATVEVRTPKAVFVVRATEFEPAAPSGKSPVQPVAIAPVDDGKVRYAGFAPTA